MSGQIISYSDLFSNFTSETLKSFHRVGKLDLHSGDQFEIEIPGRVHNKKINPLIRLATPKDVDEIIFTYEDIYEGSYPYKEMEDREEILKMLKSPNVEWLIFETNEGEVVGCFTFVLDFDHKLGYIRGFVIKKKFLGKVDIIKMAMGSFVSMYRKYNNRIFRWYGECRTAHAKSQYFCAAAGFKPIALYPCKDVFYNKVESDLLIITYDERALREYRNKKMPIIVPSVEPQFLFSQERYRLGDYLVKDPSIVMKASKVEKIRKALKVSVSKDRFDYTEFKLSITGSNSYFKFLYTPNVKNFEKTEYKVKNVEELYVFVKKFMRQAKELGVRYLECFVSAYNNIHQKVFLEAGLLPRGYIPSWKYDEKKDSFDDNILFNYHEGVLDKNMDLIDDSRQLMLVLEEDEVDRYATQKRVVLEKFPAYYKLQTKVSKVWEYPKVVKSSIVGGLALFIFLLVDSVFIANIFSQSSYNFILHTISNLGSSKVTPFPFMFDISCYIAGGTSLLFYCYFFRRMKNVPKKEKSQICIRCGAILGVVGSLGMIFVGIFSLERAYGIVHGISSIVAFGGFVLSILIFSMVIFQLSTPYSKLIAVNGLIPLISCFLFFIILTPLFEWILLISIISSVYSLFFWVTLR